MEQSTTPQEHLEEYLKREGLYSVIPEYRRPLLFTLPIAFIWLAGLWILATCLLFRHRGLSGLIMAFLGLPVLFVSILLILGVFFVIRQFRSGKKLTSADAGTVGGFLLFGLPVLAAIALGLYLKSWSIPVWYAMLSAVGIVLILLLQIQAYRVHLLIEFARSMFRVLWRSVALLLVLVPLLLVVVLLSVFSQELWESLGGLSPARFVGSAVLIALPAILFVLASLKREAVEIIGEFPEEERIVRNAESIPFVKSKLDSGFISEEEWAGLRSELKWRDKGKLAENLMPVLQNKVKVWLALLLVLTGIALAIAFFVYFCIFFNVLLKPSLVATWVDMQLEKLIVPLSCCGYSWEIGLPNTVIPITKISLLLAIFLVMMSSVYALTNDSFKKIFTEWLNWLVDKFNISSTCQKVL